MGGNDAGLALAYLTLLGLAYHTLAFLGLKYLFTGNQDPCSCRAGPALSLEEPDVPEPQGLALHMEPAPASGGAGDRSCARMR